MTPPPAKPLIRAATAADLPRIVAAADAVFRSPAPTGLGSMGHDYPLLFEPGNAGHLIIAEDGGGILAHAGYVLCEARLDGHSVRVATIGAVFTRPDERQRGLATSVLTAAVDSAQKAGAELGLVSGRRGLYERAGFVPYPACPRFRVSAQGSAKSSDAAVAVEVARYSPDALDDLMRLSAGERVHFVRSADDWRRLLDAGVLFFEPAETFLVRRAGATVAYLAVGRPSSGHDEDAPSTSDDARGARVLELAGDRRAIAEAAPTVARLLGVATLDLICSPDDRSFEEDARTRSWPADEVSMPFTTAWWNPARQGLPLPFYGFNYV
jgi:predicted N-acetyltransferase YhbS